MRSFGWVVTLALGLMMVAGTAQAQDAQRCPQTLPAPVTAKRDAIIAAAKAADFTALRKLMAKEFIFSFGGDTDPIAYWRQLGKEGTDIPRFIAAVFAMGCAREPNSGDFIFPVAAEIDWPKLTAAEKQAMQALYGSSIDDWYVEGREKGYYVGWRGVIEKSGAWRVFVAGD